MPATMGQDEATEVMLVLQEVLRDYKFAGALAQLLAVNGQDAGREFPKHPEVTAHGSERERE